jgi:quercetin dioxygenase-like cupin family protein
MRIFKTGVNAAGTSCLVAIDEIVLNPVGDDFRIGLAYETHGPFPPVRPMGFADLIDQQLAPGRIRWMLVEYGPGAQTPVHHTDTLDFETVLDGSVELILDDGAHLLEVGDMVVVAGIDHWWKAGPRGCRLSVILIGSPGRDDAAEGI